MSETTTGAPASQLPPPRRCNRWVSLLLSLLLLVVGGGIGSGLPLLGVVKKAQTAIRHPEQAPARITARLKHTLNLTPEQAQSVEAILRKQQVALQDIRRDAQPRVEAELNKARDEVAAVLNPEQAAHWRELFEAKKANWMPPMPPPRPTTRPAGS